MGLKCSHGAFHGSYGSFNRLRIATCRALGGSWPPHEDRIRYPNDKLWYYDETRFALLMGVRKFLCHSDCDGEIPSYQCGAVADDLEKQILPIIEDDELAWGHLGHPGGIKAVLQTFIDGCRRASAAGEDLTFG